MSLYKFSTIVSLILVQCHVRQTRPQARHPMAMPRPAGFMLRQGAYAPPPGPARPGFANLHKQAAFKTTRYSAPDPEALMIRS